MILINLILSNKLSEFKDNNQIISTSKFNAQLFKLQNEFNLINTLYQEIAKQVELSKIQVNHDLLNFCLDYWSNIIDEDKAKVYKKGLFYMGLYFIRMIPFILSKKEQQYITPLLLENKFINDSYVIDL